MKRILLILSLSLILFLPSCSGGNHSEKKKIVYWSMWNETESQGQAVKAAIEDYMAKHPDIEVEINFNGREIRKTLQPALDNGQTIDFWDENIERTTKNWGKYALKLDDYITNVYDTTGGKPYEDVIIKSLLDLGRSFSSDGSLYAIPYQPFVFLFNYNKKIFREAGIEKVPETWQEFKDACAKIKALGIPPITDDDAEINALLGYHMAKYKGTEFVQKVVTEGLWDDPTVLKAAKDWQEMVELGYISPKVAGNKFPAGRHELARGEAAMFLNGTWVPNFVMETAGEDFEWGHFPYPTVEGGTDGLYDMHYGSQSFQINKDTKYPKEIFDLIVHLTTGKWDEEIAKRSYALPVSSTSTYWTKQLEDTKEIFPKLGKYYPLDGGIDVNTEKTPIINANVIKLMSGQITAEEFIAEMKK
ncbi:ABC transporter substrate-binding protein [Brachyspira pulli]|uniref:ABC transporter substrate-binding protein n=1 Tax=Brachyspira pulli TaxID=310721 RepID=UPI0030047845